MMYCFDPDLIHVETEPNGKKIGEWHGGEDDGKLCMVFRIQVCPKHPDERQYFVVGAEVARKLLMELQGFVDLVDSGKVVKALYDQTGESEED